MTATPKWDFVSVEDYLASELTAETKSEYREGVVYAMAGSRNGHNRIAMNAAVALGSQLRGKPCQPFNSDTKVKIDRPGDRRFYYPDLMVVCEENSDDEQFQEHPVVILEVLSPSTRRIDLSEKRDAYLTIPSLQAYLIAEAEFSRVIVWRRDASGTFSQEILEASEDVIDLACIDATLSLADLYEGLRFQ